MPRVSLAGDPAAPNSTRVRAHCPDLVERLTAFYEQLWRSTRVDAGMKELVRMRCATINDCEY